MTLQANYDAMMQDLEKYRGIDPLVFLKGVSIAKPPTDPELRFMRAEALQLLAGRLHAAITLCDFQNDLVVGPQGIFIDIGGVRMDCSRTQIYLKSSGVPIQNQGEQMLAALHGRDIEVNTVVDIGANFGEISLYFARHCPGARVIAIEPSSDNLTVFHLNKGVQAFATERLEIVQRAIADHEGVAAITRGAGTMNHLQRPGESAATEPVRCLRLDTLFDELGIGHADFVKIDIEGGEPKLKEAMLALGDRVRAYYIEFSQFAPIDDYIGLATAMLSRGFSCHDELFATRFVAADEVARYLRTEFTRGPIAVTNLWFLAPA